MFSIIEAFVLFLEVGLSNKRNVVTSAVANIDMPAAISLFFISKSFNVIKSLKFNEGKTNIGKSLYADTCGKQRKQCDEQHFFRAKGLLLAEKSW